MTPSKPCDKVTCRVGSSEKKMELRVVQGFVTFRVGSSEILGEPTESADARDLPCRQLRNIMSPRAVKWDM